MMNKKLLLCVLMIFIMLTALQAVSADPYTILINPDSKPFKYVDDEGKIGGIDPDIMAAIAAAGGFEYELVSQDFEKLLADVSECKADAAISAISVTEDREQNVLFSASYLISNQHIYVKMELGDETSLASEKISKVGVKKATTAEDHAADLAAEAGFAVETYHDYAALFEALDKGEVDAVVADEYLAKPFADEYDVMVIGAPLSVERYAIAVCPERTDLYEAVTLGLEEIRENGTLDRIILENLID